MKKVIIMALAIFSFVVTVKAEKTVVTTQEYSVPGIAKGVSVSGSSVTTICDPCGSCVCFSGVLTVKIEEQNIIKKHITINGKDENGSDFHISGNILEMSNGLLTNGSIQYSYILDELQQN